MSDHVYKRTGKNDENTMFETEMTIIKNQEDVKNSGDRNFLGSESDSGSDDHDGDEDFQNDLQELDEEDDDNEKTKSLQDDKIHFLLKKYKFVLRLVIANFFYLMSLEHCYDTYKHCFKKMHNHFFYWGVYILIASLIFVNMIINILKGVYQGVIEEKFEEMKIPILKLIFVSGNYLYLCSLQPGFTWKSHGTLSRIFFSMFIMKIFIVKISLMVYRRLKKWRENIAYIVLGLLVLKIFVFVGARIWFTTDEFYKGFDKKRIEDCEGCCKFRKIGVNWYSAFDELFWSFSHQNSDCVHHKDDLSFIYKRFNGAWPKDLKYLAYPRSEHMSNKIRQHYQLFQEEFMKKMEQVSDLETASHKYHSFLDFTKNPNKPKIVTRIRRDEKLITKMKEVMQKNPTMKRPNVLVLMIDSLSRQHFFRKMPKTHLYLEKMFGDSSSNTTSRFSAYQFFRFHGLRQHHMANLLALRYDDREYWEAIHPWERFENNYKDEGYITATASAKCEVDELDIERDKKAKKYADRRPLDYEFFGAACDPNSTPKNQAYSVLKGPFSEFRRCVYGVDASKHQLDFTIEFWRKYKDMPKVQMVTLMDGHEFTGELPVYLDEHLPSFFEKMKNEGLLDDAIVFILSDHGNNANLFFKGTASGKDELVNPFFTMFMSENNAKIYGSTTKKNEQKLISHHDVNRVLNELVGVKKEYTGQNFLLHEIDPERTCGDAMIPPTFCRCVHSKNLDLNKLKRKKKYKHRFPLRDQKSNP